MFIFVNYKLELLKSSLLLRNTCDIHINDFNGGEYVRTFTKLSKACLYLNIMVITNIFISSLFAGNI